MIKRKPLPSKEKILSVLKYNKVTGEFVWKARQDRHFNSRLVGKKAGTKDNNGYIKIWVFGQIIAAHRLVWFLEHGTNPYLIDHIDGNESNNHISNLRESDYRKNGQNRRSHRAGRLVGAYKNKRSKSERWHSVIQINNKKVWLGTFKTKEDAHAEYMKVSKTLV